LKKKKESPYRKSILFLIYFMKEEKSMSTKIKPLHDRVVIRRKEEERTTASGIVIPDNATEKPMLGVVLAVGPGKVLENGDVRALCVKVGDTVLFGKYAGNEVKLHGDEVIVMREDDIIGVIA
jgi:chaperonin GroES